MLLKRMQPAIKLFKEMDMIELADILSKATPQNLIIISGIIESYLGVDILDISKPADVDQDQRQSVKAAWAEHRDIVRNTIFQRIGETVASGERVSFSREDKKFLYRLTAFLVTFSCLYIAAITFLPIPKDNVRFADVCLGFILGSILSTIMGYFFVSTSKNLRQKPAVQPEPEAKEKGK